MATPDPTEAVLALVTAALADVLDGDPSALATVCEELDATVPDAEFKAWTMQAHGALSRLVGVLLAGFADLGVDPRAVWADVCLQMATAPQP